jgi:hypothetical protein
VGINITSKSRKPLRIVQEKSFFAAVDYCSDLDKSSENFTPCTQRDKRAMNAEKSKSKAQPLRASHESNCRWLEVILSKLNVISISPYIQKQKTDIEMIILFS